MSEKRPYRMMYLCPMIKEALPEDGSIYDYFIECRDFMYSTPDLIDHNVPLVKLSFGREQLILLMDRDYYFLNWRKYDGPEVEFSRTIASWQLCTDFRGMSYQDFECWLLDYFDQHKRQLQKDNNT